MSGFEARCCQLFSFLRVTPLGLLRRIFKTEASWVTELYVVASAFLPFFLLALWYPGGLQGRSYSCVILLFGAWTVFSVWIELTNILLFDPLRSEAQGKRYFRIGTVRSIILAGCNYVQVLGWFAVFYRNWEQSFSGNFSGPNTWMGSVYYSVVTMTTLGYGDIKPATLWGAFIATVHVLMGLFIVVFVFGSFVSLLVQQQGNKTHKSRNTIETKAEEKPTREMGQHYSIIIAGLALIVSIYSLWLARKELVLAHRPYVYGTCRQANKNGKVGMDINTVLVACRNAPARITKGEFSYIIVETQKDGTDIVRTRYKEDFGEQIVYPSDPPNLQWTVLYDFKKEFLDDNPEVTLRRKVRIDYKELSSNRTYYFEGIWNFNRKFDVWEAENMEGD